MSNYSSIGFPVTSEEELRDLVASLIDVAAVVPAEHGTYLLYEDPSGAAFWIQVDQHNSIAGVNPHFNGRSHRRVGLQSDVERPNSELDGAIYAWANPSSIDDLESGEYPFVFDLPDRSLLGDIVFPQIIDVQLAAFAHEVSFFASEEEFYSHDSADGAKMAAESFIPSGLFLSDEAPAGTPPEAKAVFTGRILDVCENMNAFTGHSFISAKTNTFGGLIDIVVDPILAPQLPKAGGIVQGSFWLSGRLLDPLSHPGEPVQKKRFGLF
ncbi:MAG: hypothetical protein AAF331_15325 [Pseudomonadota bacterium]